MHDIELIALQEQAQTVGFDLVGVHVRIPPSERILAAQQIGEPVTASRSAFSKRKLPPENSAQLVGEFIVHASSQGVSSPPFSLEYQIEGHTSTLLLNPRVVICTCSK
ncbi:MAG: hypothetical protein V9G19_25895 [Tetrasphaera sp.]